MSIWFQKSFICRSERIPRMGDQGACCPVKQVRVFPSSLFSIFFKKCVKCLFPLSRLCTLIKYIGVENPLFKFQGYSCWELDSKSYICWKNLNLNPQVVGSDDTVGLFILSTSLSALPPSHCLDSCVYNKVTKFKSDVITQWKINQKWTMVKRIN